MINRSRFSADGLILVKCYICGADIGYFPYTGFSTAVCIKCQDPQKEEEKIIKEIPQTYTEMIITKIVEVKDDLGKMINNIGKRRTRGKPDSNK